MVISIYYSNYIIIALLLVCGLLCCCYYYFISLYYINIYDIYAQDGNTALIWACIKEKVDVVKVLLQAGANMDIQDKVRNNVM